MYFPSSTEVEDLLDDLFEDLAPLLSICLIAELYRFTCEVIKKEYLEK